MNTLRRQRRDNPDYDKDPDWNKVVLVPITRVTQTTSNNTVITVRVLHDLSLNFAKLKKEDIKLSIIYSKYQDSK